MTKQQMSAEVFCCRFFLLREEGSLASSLFEKKRQQKTSADIWCLVFSHWFFVTGLAYPMKRTSMKKGYTLKDFNTYLELEMNLKQ